ncbi:hypothetical protein AAG570_005668, partial [Ranatra chinensis]
HNAERLLKLIEIVYRWLPLGTVINNKVLVVHGGISDSTDVNWIKRIERQKYASLLRPPVTEGIASGTELIDKQEWKQVFDILWSDPQSSEGCIPNSLRGAGTYFGPDVTKQFLERHNYMYLVRSHECKPDGYEMTHGNKVITIFSASNYYETGSNKGAYMKFVGTELRFHFVQFTSATKLGPTQLSFRQRVGLIESSAIRELLSKVNFYRSKLIQEFAAQDPEGTGQITVAQWCNSMEKVTGLNIPWRMLRMKLVTVDFSGMAQYMTTFQENLNKREVSMAQYIPLFFAIPILVIVYGFKNTLGEVAGTPMVCKLEDGETGGPFGENHEATYVLAFLAGYGQFFDQRIGVEFLVSSCGEGGGGASIIRLRILDWSD